MLLAEVRQCEQAINKLLGLALDTSVDPTVQLERFRKVVVELMGEVAPDAIPRLAARLRPIEDLPA